MKTEQLIVEFQNKDIKAFEKLYKMYNKSILGVIFNIVRDKDIAEEILQDVFIKAWDNCTSFNLDKGRFFTWILNIARNTAIDKTRSKSFKNGQKNLNSDYFVDILETSESLDSLTDIIGIKNFVDKLSEKCKIVIDYLYFKGYTQKEMSEELDMPIGTIKTRNRACINVLRNNLKL